MVATRDPIRYVRLRHTHAFCPAAIYCNGGGWKKSPGCLAQRPDLAERAQWSSSLAAPLCVDPASNLYVPACLVSQSSVLTSKWQGASLRHVPPAFMDLLPGPVLCLGISCYPVHQSASSPCIIKAVGWCIRTVLYICVLYASILCAYLNQQLSATLLSPECTEVST